jgi:hypothetical protein
MDAQRMHSELELLRSAYPDLEYRVADGAHWVRIPAYPVPHGWFADGRPVDAAEVVFQIPPLGQPPYAFRVRPTITLSGGATPNNYTPAVPTPWGINFAQFSWAPVESWVPKTDVRAGTNMLSFARSFGARLDDLT